MKKIMKSENDYTITNVTAYTEDKEESNRKQSLENTNEILFSHNSQFMLNKRLIKSSKNLPKKRKKNKSFSFKHKEYYDEWEGVNMDKWFKNKITIITDAKNPKKKVYKLCLDEKNRNRGPILTAEKEKGIYIIRNNEEAVAKIRWNIFSNHFKVYDDKNNLIEEIIYNFNFRGWNGPTKLQILMPKNASKSNSCSYNKNRMTLNKMKNKAPEYNDMLNVYVLRFIRRKVIPNEKNIQIIYSEYKEDNNNILLQFAQSSHNQFFLDYKYPFNNITAFALGITSLSSRTFCK
jgi:hypothetical protein